MGGHAGLTVCFLSEDLYVKTRLQFDETAKQLQNLESATRKAVCVAVQEFNKSQVNPAGAGGGTPVPNRFLRAPRLPWSQAQPIYWARSQPRPRGALRWEGQERGAA